MNIKLATLFFFIVSVNVMADQTYNLSASVKHNDKVLISPELKLIEGDWEQIQNDSCIYSSKVSEQPDNTLLVEIDISCGDFEFQPSFTLTPESGESAFEIGELGNVWVFEVSVLAQH
jgi:hypothetical protein|tara:strand:+ start:464 stop:817 length:354 start_codon:yes stop_codon:yes gene_type:complete